MLAAVASDVIHYCVSMGSVFHFYKVNLNIHCCVSQDKSHCIIWVNVTSPTSTGQLQGCQGPSGSKAPLEKPSTHSSGPHLGCVSGLPGSISNSLMPDLHFAESPGRYRCTHLNRAVVPKLQSTSSCWPGMGAEIWLPHVSALALCHLFLLGSEGNAGTWVKAGRCCSYSLLSLPRKFKLDEIIFHHICGQVWVFCQWLIFKESTRIWGIELYFRS